MPILHKDNPLSKLEHIPIEALSTQTVINMHRGSREQVRKIFAPRFPLKESVFVDSFDTKLIMVNAGIGVAFAPPFVFPVADRYTNIVLKKTIPPYDARIFRAYYWPGPYNFASTEDSLKTSATFPFTEEGKQQVVDWLNARWTEEKELFQSL